ncbi:MAG TPA: PilT/PilU family type 4a pilus ATPase [Candidatus Hydrogenedentes bacterium]|nr:PilT/PilU family type 4a pilus ATPase [Candidatus Hydrogenedentota bacterium]HPG65932.1 PilT/PilU family type 4a pilus ATPase [Candidatus Hydrogenedentota bacterium]
MPEMVLGTGQKKSIREVVCMLADEIFKYQGPPLRIVARAENVEFTADRKDYFGEFNVFLIRAVPLRSQVDALVETTREYDDVCRLAEEDGWHTMECPPADRFHISEDRIRAAVDTLCGHLVLPEVWRVRGEGFSGDPISVELLFKAMIQYKASDVHLSPGEHPVFRIDNETRHSELLSALSAAQILSLVRRISPDEHWAEFEAKRQTSFNYHQIGLGYARVSAFFKSGAPHCTFRFLPEDIPSFDALKIPKETMIKLADLHRGLLLVTGMTGSGKTTTAAAIIDWINQHREVHIVTIEDPIEYVHRNKASIISQRCLGNDVNSFAEAVTGAMRHDPDVIMLGEMRDSDTVRAAITAASTGHLVVSTLHSNTASDVVSRIVSFFDPVERDLVRLQLRDCLKCIICQRLVPRIGGGRVPALEMLFNDTKPISDAIDEGDTDGLRIGMQQTTSHSLIFEQYLHTLYKEKKVDLEHCREHATDISIFDQLVMGTYSVPRLEALKAARDASQQARKKE